MPRVNTVQEIFANIGQNFKPDKAEGVDAIFQFVLTGDNGGNYWIKVANKQADVHEGENEAPTMVVTATADDYLALVNGDLNPMMAFMQGKIKVKGEMALALKLQALFGLGA
ncbi:MAG: SCP2 sterol-binding domain-containing protein [Chloroflexi bacterium]|nr:SCP2 sterol-binding domain-containing protein [Chloroflexota bacterium]